MLLVNIKDHPIDGNGNIEIDLVDVLNTLSIEDLDIIADKITSNSNINDKYIDAIADNLHWSKHDDLVYKLDGHDCSDHIECECEDTDIDSFSDSELVDELSTRYSKTLNSSSTLDFFIQNLAKFDIEDLEKLVENAPKWRV